MQGTAESLMSRFEGLFFLSPADLFLSEQATLIKSRVQYQVPYKLRVKKALTKSFH